MSAPYWSVKHVAAAELLPEKLVRGRAYFVDDEQIIVIDHGQGPVIYGGRPGPQGASGEPSEHMQEQIDYLAKASFLTNRTIWETESRNDKKFASLSERIDSNDEAVRSELSALDEALHNELSDLEERLTLSIAELDDRTGKDFQRSIEHTNDNASHLQEQINYNSSAVLSLINTIQDKFTQIDSALAILTKAVANLYPSTFNPGGQDQSDPLDGETLSTDAGTWTIQQTILEDGMIVLELEAQKLLIETLKAGDKVAYDGTEWTVAECAEEDGMISITLKP